MTRSSSDSSREAAAIELPGVVGGSDATSTTDKPLLSPGDLEFDLESYLDRQGTVNDIVNARSGDRTSIRLVRQLQQQLNRWDDERGISFLHLSGLDLEGGTKPLEFHGRAQKLVLTGSNIPGFKASGADLRGSVWAATHAPGVELDDANLDNALFPLADLKGGSLERARGYRVVFNLANLADVRSRGLVIPASYLIGTLGLTEAVVGNIADLTGSRVIGEQGQGQDRPDMGNILAARFGSIDESDPEKILKHRMRLLSNAEVFRGQQFVDRLSPGLTRRGVIIDDVLLENVGIEGGDFEGSLISRFRAHRAGMRTTKMAGVILGGDSRLDNADMAFMWRPGSIMFGGTMRDTEVSGNIAGTLHVGVNTEGTVISPDANGPGALFIGDKRYAPTLGAPSLEGDVKILEPKDLPVRPMKAIAAFARQQAALTARTGEETPAIESGS